MPRCISIRAIEMGKYGTIVVWASDPDDDRAARRDRIYRTVDELEQILTPMPRSPAIEKTHELSLLLTSLAEKTRAHERRLTSFRAMEKYLFGKPAGKPDQMPQHIKDQLTLKPPESARPIVVSLKPAFAAATAALNGEIVALALRANELDKRLP